MVSYPCKGRTISTMVFKPSPRPQGADRWTTKNLEKPRRKPTHRAKQPQHVLCLPNLVRVDGASLSMVSCTGVGYQRAQMCWLSNSSEGVLGEGELEGGVAGA